MNTIEISNELIQFIESSPSMFHSIKTIRTYLEEDGLHIFLNLVLGMLKRVENIIQFVTTQV